MLWFQSGMPKQNDDGFKRSTIKVPVELWKRVDHAATESDMSIQDYVTKILDEKVPRFVFTKSVRKEK